MQVVFRKLAKNVLNLKQKRITQLLEQTEARLRAGNAMGSRGQTPPRNHRRWHRLATRGFPWIMSEDEADEASDLVEPESPPLPSLPDVRLLKRAPVSPNLSPLTCRRPLHTDPELLPLNTPLYMATDSRSPTTDPNLAPFFDHFPCVYVLNDFAEARKGSIAAGPTGEDNNVVVEGLVKLIKQDGWTSEWDGQGLATYLFPFLEAEVVAKSLAVVGSEPWGFGGTVSSCGSAQLTLCVTFRGSPRFDIFGIRDGDVA